MEAYAPFRHRNFTALLAGSGITNFGLQMLSLAVSWDLYEQTKSALVLGNVGVVQVAPFILFSLFAGDFADRHSRQRILLITQAVIVLSSAFLVFAPSSVALIYGCLFLNASARAFQGPARLAMLPNSVPPDLLRPAITWNTSANEIASIGGPAAAGLLIAAAGTKTVYAAQFVCLLISLVCFVFLKIPGTRTTGVERQSLLEGARFLWANKLVFSALSLDLLAVLFGGATALLPIFATDILHVGAHGLGWLRAAPSLGAISMALAQTHGLRIRQPGRTLLWSVAGFGVAIILFGVSQSFWFSLAMLYLTGALDNISVVLRQSLVQMETPDYLRGRVLAVNNIFISCSNQLGAVESGWAAALLGTVPSVVFGGTATIVVVVLFAWRSAHLRHWRY